MQPPCAKRRRTDTVDEPIRNETETIHPEMAWNKEMNAFYNDPWNFAMNGVVVDEISEQWYQLSNSASSCPSGCWLKCGEKADSFEEEFVTEAVEIGDSTVARESELTNSPKQESNCITCESSGHSASLSSSACCLKCGENTFSFEEECAETAIELEIADSRVARESELSNSPKQETNCITCESSGHSSACCLKCGEKADLFEGDKCVICQICGYQGHSKFNCIINSWNATIAPSTWHHNKVLENPRNFVFSWSTSGQAGEFYESGKDLE